MEVPRCRHRAVKLHRTHGLSISSWSAVPHPVRAVLDEAERMVGHLLPHSSTTPLGVTKFSHETEQTWPRGSEGRWRHAKHLSIGQIACCGAAKLTSFSHPGGPMETQESKKCCIQLILLPKGPPQIGSESSKLLFRRKTHCKVWSQRTGCH